MDGPNQGQSTNKQPIWTNFSHQGFALIGATLFLFEILFLFLYVDPFWLGVELLPWGIPAVVVMAFLAHYLLLGLESSAACTLLAPVFKGRPPLLYRRWLLFDEMSITFGIKRVLFEAIDEASLTLLGNLVLRTRRICGAARMVGGKDKNPAEIVFKAPFSALSLQSQQRFIQLLQAKRPELSINDRLTKQLAQPALKGIAFAQGIAVVFLGAVLMDFGYSNFRYLEILKDYYMAERAALEGTLSSGTQYYDRAESIRLHPLPISWISRKVMNIGKIEAGVEQARSEALWALGRKDDAVDVALIATEQAPKSFAFRLRLARLYAALGKESQAVEEISKAADDHKDSLLPRLYMLAMFLDKRQLDKAREFIDGYVKHLDEDVFSPPPAWPPGEAPFLHELFYKEDLNFIFQRLLNRK